MSLQYFKFFRTSNKVIAGIIGIAGEGLAKLLKLFRRGAA